MISRPIALLYIVFECFNVLINTEYSYFDGWLKLLKTLRNLMIH